jgi:hypothetical protein
MAGTEANVASKRVTEGTSGLAGPARKSAIAGTSGALFFARDVAATTTLLTIPVTSRAVVPSARITGTWDRPLSVPEAN